MHNSGEEKKRQGWERQNCRTPNDGYEEATIAGPWHTQAGSTNTNIKVKIDFTLTELSATNVVT